MNFDEEKEQVISSDEYSDEDDEYSDEDDEDDNDALMNDAISAQNVRSNEYVSHDKQPNWRIDQKQKELSSLIRRNKISIIYKKKSIKWLNSKRQRDRYKEHINRNARNSKITQAECPAVVSLSEMQKPGDAQNPNAVNIQGIINVRNKDSNFDVKTIKEDINEVTNTHQSDFSTFINHTNEVVNVQPENVPSVAIEKKNHQDENLENIQKIKETDENSKKRPRSNSPPLLNQNKESPKYNTGIDNMFSKFDNIARNHVDNVTNSCLKTLSEKMENLSSEIDLLNEALHEKEKELNHLSYLKMVKEEIFARLNRKRYTLQKSEDFKDKQHQYTLLELKQLEICLSDKKSSSSSDTIQKLIENRASMSTYDLEREKNNTSRLHSLLVSQNMLHATELLDNTCFARNNKKLNIGLTNKTCEMGNEKVMNMMNTKGRQGEMRNVKSLIEDFRSNNPELLPPKSKRIKSAELNVQQVFSIPLLDKISRSQLFNKDNHFSSNSVNEISITPIVRPKKMSPCHLEGVRLEEKYSKNKGNINGIYARNIQYPLCQECKTKESRFVCAGCGNQWYCSKNCQVTAWEIHSDLCTE